MRLAFFDWRMEGGVVTERRATCGPATYVIEFHKGFYFARPNPGAKVIDTADGRIDHGSFGAAQEACEAHLQAILDAAKEHDAFKPCAKCGKPVSTLEDGSPGAELRDGRWACSESCWDALAGTPTPPKDHPNA